jgi:hypothetical protein
MLLLYKFDCPFDRISHQVYFNNLGSTNVYTQTYIKQKLFIPQYRVWYQLVMYIILCVLACIVSSLRFHLQPSGPGKPYYGRDYSHNMLSTFYIGI